MSAADPTPAGHWGPTQHFRWAASVSPQDVEAGVRQKYILEQLWANYTYRGTCEWRPVAQVGFGASRAGPSFDDLRAKGPA